MMAAVIVQEGLPTQSWRTAAIVTLAVVQTWPRESIVRLLVNLQPAPGVSGSVPSANGRPQSAKEISLIVCPAAQLRVRSHPTL